MNGRISWDRYNGDDLEAVIAMMINREHTESIRIRPSQGDGGIDILDRGVGPNGGDVVYQVKNYTSPLDSGQKSKIKSSLEKIMHPDKRDDRWAGLNVTRWRLVLPLDPTPEEYTWFRETLLANYNVDAVWDGLTVVEQLAAKYDDVVDYYLRQGATKIQQAMVAVYNCTWLDNIPTDKLSPQEISERVQRSLSVLEHDPHYLYDFHFGHGDLPEFPKRPNLVLSVGQSDRESDSWQAIEVIARCAESVNQCPITINGRITAKTGSKLDSDVREFLDFGTPFSSPPASFEGTLDAPGGLGGNFDSASISILPSPSHDLGDNRDLHLEILDSNEQVIGAVDAERIGRSQGALGSRAVFNESNGVLSLAILFNQAEQSTSITLTTKKFFGKPVAAVRDGLEFVANFRSPYSLRTSRKHTPANLGACIHLPIADDEERTSSIELQLHVARLLVELQNYTSDRLVFPSAEVIDEQLRSWEQSIGLLDGESLVGTIADDKVLVVVVDEETAVPEVSFSIRIPLATWVGETLVQLGYTDVHIEDPEYVAEPVVQGDRKLHSIRVPSNRIRYTIAED
ncbi:hypothetical protein PQI66_08000 [Corynebacterium sp. USCH3]|uniref:hypothetical protein n=1 Tax=Corynebacterium sp. USCH3 TaxID=3024840 RepID=UPI0030A46276